MASCRRVEIQNGMIYVDAGEFGSVGREVLTDRNKVRLTKEQWDITRVGLMCTESDLIANWKIAILRFCDETKRCDFQFVEEVQKVGRRLDELKRAGLYVRGVGE